MSALESAPIIARRPRFSALKTYPSVAETALDAALKCKPRFWAVSRVLLRRSRQIDVHDVATDTAMPALSFVIILRAT